MDILKIVLTILFVIDCIALSAIILLQEGKSAGLGTISGGTFHGGGACEVYKVSCDLVHRVGSRTELGCI